MLRFDASSATITIDSPPGVRDPRIGFQPLQPIRLDSALSDLMNDLSHLIQGNKVWFVSDPIRASGMVAVSSEVSEFEIIWTTGMSIGTPRNPHVVMIFRYHAARHGGNRTLVRCF